MNAGACCLRPARDKAIATAVVLVLLQLWPLLATPAHAQPRGGPAPLFDDPAPLAVTLTASWAEFLRDRDGEERYPATLEYSAEDGQRVRVPVTVERRGVTRRALCEFPPLRIRFDADGARDTLFAGQTNLKMVTHCNPRRRWEQYYIMEMLAYRIYNQLTERSFRVRALSVTYADDQRARSDEDRFAFLIEHVRDVAGRNELARVRKARIGTRSHEPNQISRFMLFQYLIGNTDFSVLTAADDERCCHNVRTLGVADEGGLYALPYDFDASGLVDAAYAVPHASLPIRTVSRRLYRGFCVHNESLAPAREQLLGLEEKTLDLIRAEPRLSERTRTQALRYVEDFYTTLKNPDRFARNITARCRK